MSFCAMDVRKELQKNFLKGSALSNMIKNETDKKERICKVGPQRDHNHRPFYSPICN